MSAARPVAAPAAPTLEVRNLRTHFFTRAGTLPAVADLSFTLERGKICLLYTSGPRRFSGDRVRGISMARLRAPTA